MRTSIIGFVILCLSACSTTTKVEQECYTKVKQELLKDWKFLPDSGYYISKNIYNLLNSDTFVNCLKKLDSTDVVNIFGTPTKAYPDRNIKNSVSVLDYRLAPSRYTVLHISLDSVQNVIQMWAESFSRVGIQH